MQIDFSIQALSANWEISLIEIKLEKETKQIYANSFGTNKKHQIYVTPEKLI